MKTRERILITALSMFNRDGVNHVSTNHIADEMDISPGNLYYHFRNKDDIIAELFDRFRRKIEMLLLAPADRAMDMEDTWLYLHLVFESIGEYRFLYRDLVDLTQNNRSLRIHFHHIIRQKREGAHSVLSALRKTGIWTGTDDELTATSTNIALVATCWLNFDAIQISESAEETDLAPAIYQVMSLVAPFLRDEERSQLQSMAEQYR